VTTTTTPTTEQPRVVGDHPGTAPLLAAGGGLFVAIVLASLYVNRRTKKGGG
jgi:hypothetical protein